MLNFKKFLAILQIALGTILAVRHMENAIPEPSQGQTKLNLVLNTVNQAVSGVPDIVTAVESKDITGIVNSVASTTVNVLNTAGIFKKV